MVAVISTGFFGLLTRLNHLWRQKSFKTHWPSTGECTLLRRLLRISTEELATILLLFPSTSRKTLLWPLMTHTNCTQTYCLRKVKGSNQYRCRFNFPRQLRQEPTVDQSLNHRHYQFMPRCNDVFLNNYNPTFTLGWRANTDMNRCTNSHAVVEYIAKYASKAETQSRSYHEIFNNVVSTVAPGTARHPLLTTATKMLNSPVVERDWSAQEISHILLGEFVTPVREPRPPNP